MKKNVSSQSMDAALQTFLGNRPSMETPKVEPQSADTQEQQEKANEVAQEQAGEVVPEQVDETPQVVRRISCKQRRASLDEYKEEFLRVPSIGGISPRSVHRRSQARVPQPQHTRCPRPHRPHVRRAQDERVGTGGKHRPSASCRLWGRHRGMA